MPQKLWILILLFIAATNVVAQNKQKALDNFFTALSQNQQFNGNVLVAENGNIVYEKSFGYADFSTKRPNAAKSSFPIASITKTFTSTAILQLSEKKQLDINDYVTKYLPTFPYTTITIKNLLSHTSGLQPYDNFFDTLRITNPDTVFTNKDILPRYASLKLPLLYQPGEDCNYDNVNFIFLSLIVEKVSGMTYQDYVRKFIFKPAGMTKTFFPKVALYHYSSKEKTNLSNTYWYRHLYSSSLQLTDTIQFISQYWNTYNFQGFGEIVSTTEDLFKYDQAFYKGTLLKSLTYNKAITPVLLNNGQPNKGNNDGSSFGLGWIIQIDSPFGKLVRSSGGAIGLRSSLYRNIDKHQTIILIDNTQNATDDIAKDVLKIINGQTVKPYRKSVAKEFGKALVDSGYNQAMVTFNKLKNDTINYLISENEFNSLGYDFMSDDRYSQALETFRFNTELFPTSWNVYDSYGEVLLKYGKKEEAINMYKKSLELNTDNQNAKKVLEQITK